MGSTVRLNLVAGETKQRAAWGGTFSDAEIVRVPEPYTDFFSEVAYQSALAQSQSKIRAPADPLRPPSPLLTNHQITFCKKKREGACNKLVAPYLLTVGL